MKTLHLLAAAAAIGALACVGAPSNGAAPGTHPHYTPQQKAASLSSMQAGLAQLQAASSAGVGGASDLQTAITDMTQALPMYHGYREKAIVDARKALRHLQSRRPNPSMAASLISTAITDAQTAINNQEQ